MLIDSFTHFAPRRYMGLLEERSAEIGLFQRLATKKPLHDLAARFAAMDEFGDYRQIISLPHPTLEELENVDRPGTARAANDDFSDLCAKHPERFAGFVASIDMTSPDQAVIEAERAIKELGAKGVQIYTNCRGRPLDDPDLLAVVVAIGRLGRPIWLHPSRPASLPDFEAEDRSRFEMWWCFGWPYETSVAVCRLALAGLFDQVPDLKILTHHAGGMIPIMSARIEFGLTALGSRSKHVDEAQVLQRLKRPVIDYLRNNILADTAMFGGNIGIEAAISFFGVENVVFASDDPFAPVRETIDSIVALPISMDDRGAILGGNAKRLLKLK